MLALIRKVGPLLLYINSVNTKIISEHYHPRIIYENFHLTQNWHFPSLFEHDGVEPAVGCHMAPCQDRKFTTFMLQMTY
jgi:hypothetical protein